MATRIGYLSGGIVTDWVVVDMDHSVSCKEKVSGDDDEDNGDGNEWVVARMLDERAHVRVSISKNVCKDDSIVNDYRAILGRGGVSIIYPILLHPAA